MEWLRPLVALNTAALHPSIDLENFAVDRVPPGLPSPLPKLRRGLAVPPTDELRRHFVIPVTAADLLYGYNQLSHLIPQVPTLDIALYDLRLHLDIYAPDWNTFRAS